MPHTSIANQAPFVWSYEAGTIKHENLDAVSKSLKDPTMRQDMVLGHAVSLCSIDTESGTTLLTSILTQPTRSMMEGKAVKAAIATLPASTEFGRVAHAFFTIPERENRDWVAQVARQDILARWGFFAPDEAAEFVMNSTSGVDPKFMRSIVEPWALAKPHECVAWAQNLPPGKYFDEAVVALIPYIDASYPNQALELAELIEDNDLKAASLARIKRTTDAGRDSSGP